MLGPQDHVEMVRHDAKPKQINRYSPAGVADRLNKSVKVRRLGTGERGQEPLSAFGA